MTIKVKHYCMNALYKIRFMLLFLHQKKGDTFPGVAFYTSLCNMVVNFFLKVALCSGFMKIMKITQLGLF